MTPHSETLGVQDDAIILAEPGPERLPSPAGSRPRPPAARSQAELALIRVKNRRREYLERNPGYFESAEHEFADPLLYDELVRQFQTPAEREADGKAKGYGRVLEGSLLRGEARLAKLAGDGTGAVGTDADSTGEAAGQATSAGTAVAPLRERTALEAEIAALSTPPGSREEAAERWREFLRERFVRGGDEDFDYAPVDGDEEYDTLARRDEEEAWFEDEDPGWASEGGGGGDAQETSDQGRERAERVLQGQTGVQDF